jgi:hypothetical protein
MKSMVNASDTVDGCFVDGPLDNPAADMPCAKLDNSVYKVWKSPIRRTRCLLA